MKTNSLLISIVCAVCLLLSAGSNQLNAQSNIWVTAYYAGWEQDHLPASQIDYTALTQINYFAAIPNADGSIDLSGNGVTYNSNVQTLVTNAHAHGVKVLLTVGGWSTEADFNSATATAATRATFIHNLMNALRQANYDGIDVDWEPLASADQANYLNLAHDLKDSLNARSTTLLMTMATQWAASVSAAAYQYFDQVNLMTYDLAGLWSGWVTWHNSALYNDISIGSQLISCDGMVKSWNKAGVPLKKLGIGIDWYGYKYSGATGPRQSISGATLVQGNRDYATIMSSDYPNMTRVWDDAAKAVYLTSSTGWVTYDDQQSIKEKISYAKNSIGGVIIWELGGGYRSTLAAGQRDSLLQAVKSAMGSSSSTDVTAPTVAISAPATGATVSGTVAITATASDNVGVAGVQFQLNGSNLGSEDTATPYTYSFNTTSQANGTYTISAVARDAAGNKSTASVSVTISNSDVTAPTVAISAPATGATVSGSVAITATASDNIGVAGVQFQLNGSNLGSEVTASPYTYSFNTTSQANGTYTISAIARDAAGNKTTASVSVTISNSDVTAPTVAISAPATGATVSGTVAITATASDNIGVVGVQFQLNGSNLGSEDTATPYTYSFNTTSQANGTYTLSAIARDAAGNKTTASVSVTISNSDVTAPTVAISAPATGTTVSGTVAITATASDNIGVAGVQFQLNGSNLGSEDTATPYTYSFNTTSQANGTYTISAIARDAAGNKSTASISVTISNSDATAPTVAISAPATGATVSGTVAITASASDNIGVAGVQFQLNGSNLCSEVTASPYSYSWNTSSQTNGTYTLSAIARDAAGNKTTTSATVTVSNSNATASDLWVDQEALASPWINASWSATVTFNSTAAHFAGTNSIKVAQKANGGLSVHNGYWNKTVSINPASYSALEFAINGGTSGLKITVLLANDAGYSFPSVSGYTVPANTWQIISVPMSKLDPNKVSFDRLDIMEKSNAARTYYVDNFRLVGTATVASKAVPGTKMIETAPSTFRLNQNYPNPFNPSTMISYELAEPTHVTLSVYNMLGQEVATLVDGQQDAGYKSVRFDMNNMPSGVYIYRLTAGSYVEMKKMTLVR